MGGISDFLSNAYSGSWLDSALSGIGGLFGNSTSPAPAPDVTPASSGGGVWGPLLASLASGGVQAWGGLQEANLANEQRQAENAQALGEADKQREFEKWKLLTTLAAKGGGGGGGGGGSAAAAMNVRRQALADMLNAAITQQGQRNDSLALFLKGTQGPYEKLLGR